jgi:mycothiol synthase
MIRAAGEADVPVLEEMASRSLDLDRVEAAGLVELLFDRGRERGSINLVSEAVPENRGASTARAGSSSPPDQESEISGALLGSVRSLPGEAPTGYVDLLVVDEASRRQGIGRDLLGAFETELRHLGATSLRIAGHPPWYLWPGVDVGYTAMICFAEATGFERFATGHNMTVELGAAPLETTADEERLVASGLVLRRAADADGPLLLAFASSFGGTWAEEVSTALSYSPARCHLALREGRVVAFAAHGVNRVSWFGPMGTDPAERGKGVGSVLLRRCLADQLASGLSHAEIAWAGPVGFYSREVGGRLSRIFWLYEKSLV